MANITKYSLPTNWSENVTGIYSYSKWVQDVSSGWFWVLISYVISIIILISLKDYETPKAFAFATFFNMIFTIIMTMVGFISTTFMYLSIILVGVAAVWLHLGSSTRI